VRLVPQGETVPAKASLLRASSAVLGHRHGLWASDAVEFWYSDSDGPARIGGWADLWDAEGIASPLCAAFERFADPERYDVDGVTNHPDRDAEAIAELQRLHLREMELKHLTPKEVFQAIRIMMIGGFGASESGTILYGWLLQERWMLRMLRAGWSPQRLADAVGVRHDQVARIVNEAGREARASRAYGRAARLRRVARLAPVISRDGPWDFTRYRAELDRVLLRAGLSNTDLPADVVYLN
jgi:hypothetical protein